MVGASSKSIGILELCNIKGLAKINGEVLELLGSLRKLTILGCENVLSVGERGVNLGSIMEYVSEVEISDCKSLESFIIPNTVEMLNLKLFPYHHLESLTCLKTLTIHDCPSMECSFLCGSWPPNLRAVSHSGLYHRPHLYLSLQFMAASNLSSPQLHDPFLRR
ncbi:hypothetical protein OSB04_013117 [Centaurea solstitialis]|uniref:Uncharacterized protein n=1 Tax=Centaurea solstitialis TaxID=347529 RepID=A0AA38TXD6_9ASTR|nr:hypothetical protein OSB04_013117 [Centaurea solstitialis]